MSKYDSFMLGISIYSGFIGIIAATLGIMTDTPIILAYACTAFTISTITGIIYAWDINTK
jgi:hypothetical protein